MTETDRSVPAEKNPFAQHSETAGCSENAPAESESDRDVVADAGPLELHVRVSSDRRRSCAVLISARFDVVAKPVDVDRGEADDGDHDGAERAQVGDRPEDRPHHAPSKRLRSVSSILQQIRKIQL